jgi:hypothetical protein
MPRKTLLEVVDMYMTKTNGFRVQSIFDTEEAESVARIAEEVFYHIVEKAPNIQFTESLIRLDAVGDLASPNYLKIPQSVSSIIDSEIKYNMTGDGVLTNYLPVVYMDPRDFLDWVAANNDKLNNVQLTTDPSSGVQYLVRNNKQPEYFTSFDGVYLAFDSFDSARDSTLQSSKSLALVSKQPVFLVQDNFYIPLPDHLMQMYVDGVVAEASEALRQEAMASARRRYNMEMAKLQGTNQRVGYGRTSRVNYGRNSNG